MICCQGAYKTAQNTAPARADAQRKRHLHNCLFDWLELFTILYLSLQNSFPIVFIVDESSRSCRSTRKRSSEEKKHPKMDLFYTSSNCCYDPSQ